MLGRQGSSGDGARFRQKDGAVAPPLAEQHRIVAKVDELMTLCDRLEAELTTAESESRRLLEAVLHEALSEKGGKGGEVSREADHGRAVGSAPDLARRRT
jgi:hypothetical protein